MFSEVIPAILSRHTTVTMPAINNLSTKAPWKCEPNVAEKWTMNTGNGGSTRWDSLLLSPFVLKGQKWLSWCQPRPFHSQAQTPYTCKHT